MSISVWNKMFSVSMIIVAAMVIIEGSGYVHSFPGVPFQLPNQRFSQTSLYQGQSGNVHKIYSQSVLEKEFSESQSNANTQYNNLIGARWPQPVITKHIYFHVAPPDPEKIRPAPLSNYRKKINYKIVFIKIPSQQRKNQAKLQELLQNQYGASAAKTLIYVLVKSPEDRPSSTAVSTPNHEVFYVKYKDNRQIKNVVSQPNSAQILQPGLVNGLN